MATLIKEWYPDGVTCFQVYQESRFLYFGAINGVDLEDTQSQDAETTEALLTEYETVKDNKLLKKIRF